MTSMIKYLPDSIRDIAELADLCVVNDPDKDEMYSDMDADTDDFYVPSATSDGIQHWENVMGVTSHGDATIEERRFTLMSRVNNRAPFSERRIRGMLDTLLGSANYTFTMTLASFDLVVTLDLGTKYQINSVIEMLENVVPAHIDITVALKYNTHQILSGYTHEELSAYTHTELQETLMN